MNIIPSLILFVGNIFPASNVQCCSKILLTEIIVQSTHSDDKCTIVPILKDTERNIRNRRSETDEYLPWR